MCEHAPFYGNVMRGDHEQRLFCAQHRILRVLPALLRSPSGLRRRYQKNRCNHYRPGKKRADRKRIRPPGGDALSERMRERVPMKTLLLLVASNVFMTLAW